MHLRSISMKGFKSFPSRTKLEFGTGVSVIAGAHGVHGSNTAEVEVVIDNGDGALEIDFSEISIVRRLGRDGEGEYRLNGARCRLVDVVEVLSDSGLGKEMHSVVSQGKVEQIVLSRPRERRLLIEEAAGLGKHRKRRRRAQLKLERTEENLGRALDVEREARSRLRPLKRQAEAAELHERLERQTLEARYALARDAAREARAGLAAAEERARAARSERDEAERLLGEVARRREQAEEAFAAQTRERERIQAGLFSARSAAERIALRLERVREQGQAATERRARRARELELLVAEAERDAPSETDPLPDERLPRPPEEDGGSTRAAWDALAPADRIRSLEREIGRLETDWQARLRDEIESLDAELEHSRGEHARLQEAAAQRKTELDAAEAEMESARVARRERIEDGRGLAPGEARRRSARREGRRRPVAGARDCERRDRRCRRAAARARLGRRVPRRRPGGLRRHRGHARRPLAGRRHRRAVAGADGWGRARV